MLRRSRNPLLVRLPILVSFEAVLRNAVWDLWDD